MENVHNAIAWYQTKIGSYDKQLWEQSVEKKLQKQSPFDLHNAPRKKVRHKTEYIDVDLIRGSTFAKTKPQVPWVYITRKAIARVLFFPFYYTWWVHQTSKRLYALLLVLYVMQVATVCVYLSNVDHGVMSDELCFTEVTLPIILMFLLCLIHSQTVLAHISHKPPKRNKNISGVIRKPRPKKTSRKGRSSGNNSTCPEDGGNTDTSRSSRRRSHNQQATDTHHHNGASDGLPTKNLEPVVPPTIDMEKNLMSRSMSDYELKPAISSSQSEFMQSVCSSLHSQYKVGDDKEQLTSGWDEVNHDFEQLQDEEDGNVYCVHKLENQKVHPTKGQRCYKTVQEVPSDVSAKKESCDVFLQPHHVHVGSTRKQRDKYCQCNSDVQFGQANIPASNKISHSMIDISQQKYKQMTENSKIMKESFNDCINIDSSKDCVDIDNSKEIIGQAYNSTPISSNQENVVSFVCGIEGNNCKFLCDVSPKLGTENIALDVVSVKPTIDVGAFSSNVQDLSSFEKDQGPEVHEAFDVCVSGPDNLGMSDFELVDHKSAHDGHSSSDKEINDFAACSNIQSWKNDLPLNSSRKQLENDETHLLANSSCSLKLKPFKWQDSGDSGINNDVPCADCKDSLCDCSPRNKWQNSPASAVEDIYDASFTSGVLSDQPHHTTHIKQSIDDDDVSSLSNPNTVIKESSNSFYDDSSNPSTLKVQTLPRSSPVSSSHPNGTDNETDNYSDCTETINLKTQSTVLCNHKNPESSEMKMDNKTSMSQNPSVESSTQLHCFSEQFVLEILNEDTLRKMSCSSLLTHSDFEQSSSSSVGHLSTASTTSSASNVSSSYCKMCNTHHIPPFTKSSSRMQHSTHHPHHHHHHLTKQQSEDGSTKHGSHERLDDDDKNDLLDESLEHIHVSDGERPSDDVSNYNPSDSDADSDGPVNMEICNKYEEKWKRLRFQDHTCSSDSKIMTSKANTNISSGTSAAKAGSGSSINGVGSRSVVGILTRKPSPLKDLAIVRKPNSNIAVTNSSGSDQELSETRNQLRRRRRTSGTPSEPVETNRIRNVPNTLGLQKTSETKGTHLSSSENETGGARTPEGSNKATMSSEEWEDRMQSDETTSSAYSSNSDVDSEDRDEGEEKTEYTTSTLHVINLLQPQSGSPSSSGNIVQPDRVSCVIWEGNECKKVDLTALDIGWAIIDKVDSLPESSDYFLIGLSFSLVICLVPLVFRAYASKETASLDDFLSWSGLMTKLLDLFGLIRNSYNWRQYLLMVNGVLQRFSLSLIFFFLLSVADRTFKQRLLYAKHFSYLTSSRRARKFTMPHFRLNKVRNIKIWLSLRSYLKRRGPQRSVDVIVSACFLCAICTVCLISLQMLKETDSYLDYLCNWELLVWCAALAVFLMRFMTVGLKINKKYRNLSVLITEQINLYLQMEQKPHKKEELILANNVLRLAEDLLKELESPFKISGFSANPLIYNIMRVVVLSAFSAVLTEVLGFKLKLHKIKIKA